MRLWTIQKMDFLKPLDWMDSVDNISMITFEHPFKRAYDWYRGEMLERIPFPIYGYRSVPIWAWPHRPNLLHSGHGERGKLKLLVEFQKLEKDVLFSDFEKWHYPLNGFTLDDSYTGPVEHTWHKIFDLSDVKGSQGTQATVWSIKASEIKSIRMFKCK